MRIGSMGVVFGVAVAVIILAADPAAAARMAAPLPFEIINEFKSNSPSLIPSASADRRTVGAPTRDLAATEPRLPPDAAISAVRGSAGSVVIITPNRSVRSKSNPRRGGGFQRMRQAYSALPVQINLPGAQSPPDGPR
jgi:hypothetical protein